MQSTDHLALCCGSYKQAALFESYDGPAQLQNIIKHTKIINCVTACWRDYRTVGVGDVIFELKKCCGISGKDVIVSGVLPDLLFSMI